MLNLINILAKINSGGNANGSKKFVSWLMVKNLKKLTAL